MKTPAALLLLALLAGGGLAACSGGDGSVDDVSSEAALSSVQSDIQTVAPDLENFYRDTTYPKTLDEAQAALEDAGIELSTGNTIGGYLFDAEATEFTLCVENESGPWATYDTAPMSMSEGGETGGCPAELQ